MDKVIVCYTSVAELSPGHQRSCIIIDHLPGDNKMFMINRYMLDDPKAMGELASMMRVAQEIVYCLNEHLGQHAGVPEEPPDPGKIDRLRAANDGLRRISESGRIPNLLDMEFK
jgi:hypothetical protein